MGMIAGRKASKRPKAEWRKKASADAFRHETAFQLHDTFNQKWCI